MADDAIKAAADKLHAELLELCKSIMLREKTRSKEETETLSRLAGIVANYERARYPHITGGSVTTNAVKVMRRVTDGMPLEEVREMAAALGRKGGLIRKARLSPEQRADIARRAANGRWSKKVDNE